tara:strand:+ start:574 stop:747 length:174 start_codon:yes stop_codon:yes gene_type:complete
MKNAIISKIIDEMYIDDKCNEIFDVELKIGNPIIIIAAVVNKGPVLSVLSRISNDSI